jgi:AraC family transcriptional regulator
MGVSNTLVERGGSPLHESSGPPPFDYRSPHGTLRMLCDSRRWNGITVRHVVQHLAPGRVWHDASASQSTVAIVLEQVGGYCEPRINLNRPAPRARYDAGHTLFVPADMTVWGYSDQIQLVRDLRLHFDSRHLESLLGEDLRRGSEADPVLLLYDDRVAQCASLLARECGPGGTGVRLFGEGITTALVALLFAQTRSDTRSRPGGLSALQLRRVLDYFHEHLSSDVSLESVALLTGLSQSQFSRAFRASMGVSPYRWFLQARVKHAKILLLSGAHGLADIASQLGFADQSHFTKAFHRATGTTPGEWRRANRS